MFTNDEMEQRAEKFVEDSVPSKPHEIAIIGAVIGTCDGAFMSPDLAPVLTIVGLRRNAVGRRVLPDFEDGDVIRFHILFGVAWSFPPGAAPTATGTVQKVDWIIPAILAGPNANRLPA